MKRSLLVFLFTPVIAAIATAQAAAPDLTLRLNGHAAAPAPLELWQGEPVIAEVALRHSDRTAQAPLSLDHPDGGWATRVKIAVTDAGGATASWPFVVAGKPSGGALALQPDAVTTLVLRLDSSAGAPIAIGRYHLAARLDLADGRGWRGVAESEPVDVEVIAAPVTPTEAVLGQRQLFRVRDALLAGDVPRAEAATDEMLRADVQRPEGFVAMALVSEAKGERRLALVYIDLAIAHAAGVSAMKPAPGVAEPAPKPVPLEYFDLQRRFEMMPSNEPEPEPLPGYPDNVVIPADATPAGSATPAAGRATPAPAAPIPARIASPEDAQFRGDSRGQWATGAEASSEYRTDKYSAREAIGEPNATGYGDRGEAWASKTADSNEEWLKVTFATPVRASAVRVRQNFNPGAIVKVEAFAADGRSAVVWSGRDTTAYTKSQTVWFVATFEPPAFPVQEIKLTLDSFTVKGWNEIDAVQLVGGP